MRLKSLYNPIQSLHTDTESDYPQCCIVVTDRDPKLSILFYTSHDNLDISFDAGGNVNAGLTATTVVSQWTWAATLLQSSTVAAKYGISGSIWYAAGASIQILLFSMLTIQLKTRAPGAKTFLQVIRARFGKRTHITFCCFALLTNIIVTAMLMLGGSAVITSLVKLISVEYATTLIAAILGGYTFIGGLGATFYVSYCNTAIIYIVMIILIFKVYEDGEDDDSNPLGSIERVFDFVSCSKGPQGNKDMSYLTIVSDEGLMFGLINIVGNFGTVFVDQSYWQSAVASKPKQGVLGLLLGGLAWFAIPFSFSTTMGLAYVALSAKQGEGLLTPDDVDAGLVPPVVAYHLLGKSGAILIMVMVLMAVTSTGSSEIMAVTSIIIYDIYALNLKPYRMTTDVNSCILCGKGRGRMANPRDKCTCISMTFCANCHQDTKNRATSRRAIKPEYKCASHGQYREYSEYLSHLRNWSMVWTTIGIIPLTITLYMIQASLGWTYLFMGILVGSAVVPITLSMFWERLTGIAMIAGSLSGTGAALVTWLAVASTYDGGLSDWYNNTGQEVAMLCGNLVSILGGGIVTIVVTFLTNKDFEPGQGSEIWENTRDIDNPLSPWMEKYQKQRGRIVSASDPRSGGRGFDSRPYHVAIALVKHFTLTFPSPHTCKSGTQLQAILEFVICARNTLHMG
ncbi:urea-proton symporter DUR3-like [Elysia marginata]|uniref:Urea-proton symporter DUR3-like n=1 Tax=Elysia marginata TaxID=1093978 RepID=A0AAV4GLG2_9GAST|nr:urea-proton symporter DUR3-like [Elysia marginata]